MRLTDEERARIAEVAYRSLTEDTVRSARLASWLLGIPFAQATAFTLVTDDAVPPGEIRFVSASGRVAGRIVNVGDDE